VMNDGLGHRQHDFVGNRRGTGGEEVLFNHWKAF
jgi:hypothetical protein